MATRQDTTSPTTLFDTLAQSAHSVFATWLKAVTDVMTEHEPKADKTLHRLQAEIAANATDPLNTLWGNPDARSKAWQTSGASLVKGVENYLEDLAHNDGNPALTDRSKFEVGRNLAATPGTVVFRNELIELIRYTPATELVREVPLLIVPPPINKYYILDLAPRRSLVEKAVADGQTVYLISWLNPREEQKDVDFTDYINHGTLAAMDFIGGPVSLMGLCYGGTLASITTAYDAVTGAGRVASLSLIVTLTDFGLDTGRMGAMISQKLVDEVYAKTQKTGVLSAQEMGAGWVWLTSDGLFFGPARKRWLLGEDAPAMDLLAWNADGTRLPSEMHREYLQRLYIDNEFARGVLDINGVRVSIKDINVPVYAAAGDTDHIVPWRSSFEGISQSSGSRRLVLIPRGHIGAIVSVGSKATHLVGDDTYTEEWLATATKVQGSWWGDWTNWLGEVSGKLVRPLFDEPDMGAAPGLYVIDADPSTYELSPATPARELIAA